eukprot:CAMPEP_0117678226 /NCGR_PEP_ID=MMETSP0804-20121206/17184_1 /TAXON_ID=1074897 /ORGANISM="Tetraselmis astigmatica, Strain CCMP880" /LENGTH=797 /DNA_ID=CAMNT_0005487599 /DNA_START=119 /DNA_END=2509 /DNA_ORIENTATION=-
MAAAGSLPGPRLSHSHSPAQPTSPPAPGGYGSGLPLLLRSSRSRVPSRFIARAKIVKGDPHRLPCSQLQIAPGCSSAGLRRRRSGLLRGPPLATATAEASGTTQNGSASAVTHVRKRLAEWVQSADPEKGTAAATAEGEEFPTSVTSWALPGAEISVTVGLTGCNLNGQKTAVVCIAAQRFSPASSKLDGTVVHWACEKSPGGNWYPPPPGWRTDPDWSIDAGGGAWQTPLGATSVAGEGHRLHCVLLEIPLKGPLKQSSAGLPFVLKAADGQWLKNGGSDFVVPLGSLLTMPLPATATTGGGEGDAPSASLSTDLGMEQQAVAAAVDPGRAERRMLELFGVHINMDLPDKEIREVPHNIDPSAVALRSAGSLGTSSTSPVVAWVIDAIASSEHNAERSLMHRYQIAHTLLARIMESQDVVGGLPALVCWLRFSAARHLTWNRNYNIKPREISAAQDLLTKRISEEMLRQPELWEMLRICLVSVGRGGQGDVGQRIRDEILTVQSKNNAKGGMMEEWHQKLHNNTSPDDVVICEALLAYLKSGLDISAYWSTLKAANIDAARLASFDRSIRSEPSFSQEQAPGLTRDLEHYLHTLKAVHCGDDLKSAAAGVLGYSQGHRKGRGVNIPPVPGVATPELLDALVFLLQPHKVPPPAPARLLRSLPPSARQAAGPFPVVLLLAHAAPAFSPFPPPVSFFQVLQSSFVLSYLWSSTLPLPTTPPPPHPVHTLPSHSSSALSCFSLHHPFPSLFLPIPPSEPASHPHMPPPFSSTSTPLLPPLFPILSFLLSSTLPLVTPLP